MPFISDEEELKASGFIPDAEATPIDTSGLDTSPRQPGQIVAPPASFKAAVEEFIRSRQPDLAPDIDPEVALGIIQGESGFDPLARSGTGPVGIAQIAERTAKSLGLKPEERLDPQKNIEAFLRLRQDDFTKFSKSVGRAPSIAESAALQVHGLPVTLKKIQAGEDLNSDKQVANLTRNIQERTGLTPDFTPDGATQPAQAQGLTREQRVEALKQPLPGEQSGIPGGLETLKERLAGGLETLKKAPTAGAMTPVQLALGLLELINAPFEAGGAAVGKPIAEAGQPALAAGLNAATQVFLPTIAGSVVGAAKAAKAARVPEAVPGLEKGVTVAGARARVAPEVVPSAPSTKQLLDEAHDIGNQAQTIIASNELKTTHPILGRIATQEDVDTAQASVREARQAAQKAINAERAGERAGITLNPTANQRLSSDDLLANPEIARRAGLTDSAIRESGEVVSGPIQEGHRGIIERTAKGENPDFAERILTGNPEDGYLDTAGQFVPEREARVRFRKAERELEEYRLAQLARLEDEKAAERASLGIADDPVVPAAQVGDDIVHGATHEEVVKNGGKEAPRDIKKNGKRFATADGHILDEGSAEGVRAQAKVNQRQNPHADVEDATARLKPGIEFPDPLVEGQLATKTAREVTEIMAKHVEEIGLTDAWKGGERINRAIAEVIRTRGAGKSAGEIADLWAQGSTYGGRILNMNKQISVILQKRLKLLREAEKAAMKAKDTVGLKEIQDEMKDLSRFSRKLPDQSKLTRAIQTLRGSLTGALRTGTKNFLDNSVRVTVFGMDSAIRDFALAVSGKTTGAGLSNLARATAATVRAGFKPSKDLVRLINEQPWVAEELFDQIMENALGRYTQLLPGNIINRWQEFGFRSIVAESNLLSRMRLARLGDDITQAPREMIEAAVMEARKVTVARNFTGQPEALLRFFQRVPILYPLTGIHFPRFLLSSVDWMFEHSPAGLWKLMGMKDPFDKATTVAKATTGIAMFGSAWLLRQSKASGPNWWAIRTSEGEDVDTRGLAIAPYLFVTDVWKNVLETAKEAESRGIQGMDAIKEGFANLKYDPIDLQEGIMGMQRLAGVGRLWLETMAGMNPGNWRERMTDHFGSILAGYLQPFSTLKDIAGGWDAEEAKIRDFRDDWVSRLVGPSAERLPGASQAMGLDERTKVLTGTPLKKDYPLWLAVGVRRVAFTAVEDEAARLGIKNQDLVPATGMNEVDRARTRMLGKLVYEPLNALIASDAYKSLDQQQRRALFLETVGFIRPIVNEVSLLEAGQGRIIEAKIKKLGGKPTSLVNLEMKRALEGILKNLR